MYKKVCSFLLSFLIFFGSYANSLAINDPASVPNNKFGIHIFSEKDLTNAASLINSSGGDWGYITIVITENERDHDRWQQVFDQMRRLHLIPIIRIATKADGPIWEKPKEEEINNWISFLNSLNWVIQNRYLIISNEPNHSSEWGGTIDPEGYAAYLKEFSQKLKAASTDFFVLPAAFDASATNSKDTMDEQKFLYRMIKATPDVFDNVDGWNSHSYPNPNFSGSEIAKGKGTIDTFEWEEDYLKSLGVSKNLPVFITETGWSDASLSDTDIAKKLDYAFKFVWSNPKIVAVTPFILDYPNAPFSEFSWQKADGSYHNFYQTTQQIVKEKGTPIQIVRGEILAAVAQPIALTGSDFVGAILAKNTGQSIWSPKDIGISSESNNFHLKDYSFNDLEPMRLGIIVFKAESPQVTGIYSTSLFLNGKKTERISGSFVIDVGVIKIDGQQINSWLAKIQNYFKNTIKL